MNVVKAIAILAVLGTAFSVVLLATFYPLILAFAGIKYLLA